ncbi:hypothetical protein Tco_1104423 [Tanacetum coccineum]
MAHQQHAVDVHPDELCPPNKRYDLMDANKKIDFEHVQCPPESKLLMNIIKNHPLRFSIAVSSLVPLIYMAQFWYTLNEDGSKYRLMFILDKKELSLTLDDFRIIFHLPQATDNNHDSFVPPSSFLDMVPLYKNELGFTMELKTSPSFKTTGLLQPWQTLCKIFSKCLTTRVTGWDQPPLQIIQMMLQRRYKDKDGMKIPAWMISEEMKHTEHYRMYAEVFGIVVPLTLSQLTESTQGMHRTPSAPRSPNPNMDARVSSAPKQSTVIHFRIPQRRSTRLTPPAPVPTVDKAYGMILQDTLQMVEGPENVIDDSSINRNDDQNIPGTRLEPRSDKESPKVEITNDEEVEITNVVIPIHVNKEEEEIIDEVYELKRREKGKIVKESRSTPFPTPIRSTRIHTDLGCYGYLFEHLRAKFLSRKSFDTLDDHVQEVMVESLPTMVDKHIKEQVEKSYMSGHILHVHPAQPQTTSVPEQKYKLYLSMKADPQLQQQNIAIWLALQMKFKTIHVPQTTCRTSSVRPQDQDDPHDDAHPKGENSAKQQKTSEYEGHMTGESSRQVNEKEQGQSSSRNQEQTNDYDFWTGSYASDDDEILTKQVS